MSGEPIPSPTGNFLSVHKLGPGFSSLLSKTYFHMEHLLCSTTRTADKLSFCTLQLLCGAYREGQQSFSFVVLCGSTVLFCGSFILSCFVGSYILSYCCIEKSTKKESVCSVNNGVMQAALSHLCKPVNTCVVGGFAQWISFVANLDIHCTKQLRT